MRKVDEELKGLGSLRHLVQEKQNPVLALGKLPD